MKRTALSLSLVAVCLLVVGISWTASHQPQTPSQTTTQTAPTRPTTDGRGKGNPKTPGLPANWPANVPLPADAQLISASTEGSLALAQLVQAGSYQTVMAADKAFYISHGYSITAESNSDFSAEDAQSRLQILFADRDHTGPIHTNVALHVSQR